MTPEEFHDWRKSLSMTQAEAAERLGVSKRSIFTYEGAGPVPQVVALACSAIASDLRSRNFERLVREQHPKLGEFLIVIPFVVDKHSSYSGTVQTVLSDEVRDWIDENTPSAKFSMRTVITPDKARRQIATIVFDDISEATLFKLRWC